MDQKIWANPRIVRVVSAGTRDVIDISNPEENRTRRLLDKKSLVSNEDMKISPRRGHKNYTLKDYRFVDKTCY